MQIDIKHPHDSIFKNVFDDIDNTKDFLVPPVLRWNT
jgi:hypothetical protein